jgi:hypothetical membrane protein
MNRTNYAPTARTIIVAMILILVGLLGTYGTAVPERIGILAYVVATVLLILGMIVRRI